MHEMMQVFGLAVVVVGMFGLGWFFGFCAGQDSKEREAIKLHVAKWEQDEAGYAVFKWKGDTRYDCEVTPIKEDQKC